MQACGGLGMPTQGLQDTRIKSLGLEDDQEARRLLRRALRDASPAAERFRWQVISIRELQPDDKDVGYTTEEGDLYIKVRDPGGGFFSYSFVLATLLHELSHLSVLGHGKAFYRRLADAAAVCGAEPLVRREVRGHVCAELLNAVCDNDARRAKALLAVLPEAAVQQHGIANGQLPLEYAAHHGRVAITRLLLDARACADACSQNGGMPPLARAAARGNARTARLLLNAGADASAVDPERCKTKCKSLLQLAAEASETLPEESDLWRKGRKPSAGPCLVPAGSGVSAVLPRPRRNSSLPALLPGAARTTVARPGLSGSLAL